MMSKFKVTLLNGAEHTVTADKFDASMGSVIVFLADPVAPATGDKQVATFNQWSSVVQVEAEAAK